MEARYLVTSLGVTQVQFWTCLECPAKARGDRDSASAHVRDSGHAVVLFRGTDELLAGVAYAMPERKAITS